MWTTPTTNHISRVAVVVLIDISGFGPDIALVNDLGRLLRAARWARLASY